MRLDEALKCSIVAWCSGLQLEIERESKLPRGRLYGFV